MSKKRKYVKRGIYLAGCFLLMLLNAVAWNSNAFCDFYIRFIFPIWVNTYGRLTGVFKFSVGEFLLMAGVALVTMALFAWIPVAFDRLKRMQEQAPGRMASRKHIFGRKSAVIAEAYRKDNEKKVPQGRKRFPRIKGFYCFCAWVLMIVCLVMTLNCTILYHASAFSEKYFGEDTGEYSLEELVAFRNMVVEKCNTLSAQMIRTEDGEIIYAPDVLKKIMEENGQQEGIAKQEEDTAEQKQGTVEQTDRKKSASVMGEQAVRAMKALGQTYDQLDGYYPKPKALLTSDFFSQQYMCGYYFPFSMEANYNDVMYIMNKPSTMCHELAHLRGYIYEDEANFISYLACTQSEDLLFQYSGYLSVLNYLDNDFYKAIGKDAKKYLEQPRIEEQVYEDKVFVTQKEWERIEKKAWISTETVEQVSDAFIETNLKVNGVADGKISYSRVVRLLLQYQRAMENEN